MSSIKKSIRDYLRTHTQNSTWTLDSVNARDAIINACRFSNSQSLKEVCNLLDINFYNTRNRVRDTNTLTEYVPSRYNISKRIENSKIRMDFMNSFLHSDNGSYYPLIRKKIKVGIDENKQDI